jgi:hypothetical protein
LHGECVHDVLENESGPAHGVHIHLVICGSQSIHIKGVYPKNELGWHLAPCRTTVYSPRTDYLHSEVVLPSAQWTLGGDTVH